MCEFFVKADPIAYEQRSRTVRMHGMLTSIRLENMVWDTLAEMAEEEGCTTNALIATFHNEILAHRGEVPNFASFLRVSSMRYLRRKVMAAERLAEMPERERASAINKPAATKVVTMAARG
jgi:predicted DNA-binding ribbon-helix-helix protein